MRELKVEDLPPTSETGRCDVVLSVISKALTDARCQIKTEVNFVELMLSLD